MNQEKDPLWMVFVENMITFITEINAGITACTLRDYRSTMCTVLKQFEACRIPTNPKEITRIHFSKYITDCLADGKKPATITGYAYVIKLYCRAHGNYCLEGVKPKMPNNKRYRVDWLSDESSYTLINTPMSVEQKMLVHLELMMGLRRIDSIRLEPGFVDWENKRLHVRGKGNGNGKERDVDFCIYPDNPEMDTESVFREYFAYRDNLIKSARAENPLVEEPNRILIYKKGASLGAFSESGVAIDNRMNDLSKKTGIKFSNHTLRRTFGRSLYDCGVKIEDIAAIMGHEDIKMTLRYLGLDFRDHKDHMSRPRFQKRTQSADLKDD